MKFLKTFLKGKLTGLGLVGVLINDLLTSYTEVGETWIGGTNQEAGALQIVSAVAILWGVLRRFTAAYKEGGPTAK